MFHKFEAREMIRIIVFDDADERRKSLQQLFDDDERISCVATFPDCSDLLEKLKNSAPDLVLMDIMMPGTDGIEATRQIKKYDPSIRVVIQTVFDDDERIFSSLKAGAEGYLLKSAPVEKIRQSIEDVYAGGAVMSPSIAIRVMQFFNGEQRSGNPANDHMLSSREKEVLRLLTDGLSYKMIAGRLDISYFTVNAHLRRIYEKLQVNSKGEAVAVALKSKILP